MRGKHSSVAHVRICGSSGTAARVILTPRAPSPTPIYTTLDGLKAGCKWLVNRYYTTRHIGALYNLAFREFHKIVISKAFSLNNSFNRGFIFSSFFHRLLNSSFRADGITPLEDFFFFFPLFFSSSRASFSYTTEGSLTGR